MTITGNIKYKEKKINIISRLGNKDVIKESLNPSD